MSSVHIYPIDDWIDHQVDSGALDCQCPCDPEIRYIDHDTGEPYPQPMIIHNALDGRE